MNNQFIMAIDPGKSGGIAVKPPNGQAYAYKMPDTGGDIVQVFGQAWEAATIEGWETIAVIEEQRGFFSGKDRPGSHMFTFGVGYGFLTGALQAQGWRVELVLPKKWQQGLGMGSKNSHASDTAWKNHLKAKAQQLFPHIKVTLNTADALLLLEYRLRQG